MSKLSDKAKGAIATKAVDVVVKPLIKKLGDKMETAKRPFWRALVKFFRGE